MPKKTICDGCPLFNEEFSRCKQGYRIRWDENIGESVSDECLIDSIEIKMFNKFGASTLVTEIYKPRLRD